MKMRFLAPLAASALLGASAVAQSNAAAVPTTPASPQSAAASSATEVNPANSSAAKARQLLDQMIAALGGQAWSHYKTSAQKGRTYSFFHGHPTSAGTLFWRFFEYPEKERTELTKDRDIIDIFNGSNGYETTYKGTTTQEAKVVEEVQRRWGHSLEVAVRVWLQDPETMLFYDGRAVADRKLVEVVTLLSEDNDAISIGIDSITHLPINKRYSWRDKDRYKVEEETIYGNYREVQGIQTPFTITTMRDGEMSGQSFFSHAEYNTSFEPGFFDARVTYQPRGRSPKN